MNALGKIEGNVLKKVTTGVNVLNLIGFFWMVLAWIWVAPLGRWYAFGGLYLFFITWVVEFVLEKRWVGLVWNRTKTYFCVLCALFLIGLVYAPWDTTTYLQNRIEHRLGLLGLGLVGIGGINRYYSLKGVFSFMIALSMVMICYLLGKINLIELIQDPNRMNVFAMARINYINAHMQFNFFLNVSLVGIWYLLFRAPQRPRWWVCVVLALCFLTIFSTIMISEGRSGFIASILLVGSMACIELWKWRKWMGIVMMMIALIIGNYGITHHSRMNGGQLQDVRLQLWQASWSLIKERPMLGYGMSQAQEKFSIAMQEYTDEGFRQIWKDQLDCVDSHNQYLHITLEFGVVGLLLLLAAYIGPVIIDNRHRLLSAYIMGLCMFQSIFDMFIMSSFCIIFCVLVLMLLLMPEECCQKQDLCQHPS